MTQRIRNIDPAHEGVLQQTVVTAECGEHFLVSTVAIGGRLGTLADYRYETMVFACDEQGKVTDWMDLQCDRYDFADEAMAGHAQLVELVYRWTVPHGRWVDLQDDDVPQLNA